MMKSLRDALNCIASLGGTVDKIEQGGRHTNIRITVCGRPGIVRIHNGGRLKTNAVAGIPAQVRNIARGNIADTDIRKSTPKKEHQP